MKPIVATLQFLSDYLPDLLTIKGIIFYSFIVYVITYILSYLRVKIVNKSLESEHVSGSKKVKEAIIKRR